MEAGSRAPLRGGGGGRGGWGLLPGIRSGLAGRVGPALGTGAALEAPSALAGFSGSQGYFGSGGSCTCDSHLLLACWPAGLPSVTLALGEPLYLSGAVSPESGKWR